MRSACLAALTFALCAAAPAQVPPLRSCGAKPPGPPRVREMVPYAQEPTAMRPFSNYAEPYFQNYTTTIEYNGAARDAAAPKPEDVPEVRIGFLGSVENHPDQKLGQAMLNGATLAVEEANRAGGYCGKPLRLMVHNDAAVWGASSNEIVKMAYDEKVWAMLGSISGDSTHIALRVSLKAELPIVNSAATDPTIPETIIPWYLTTIQDDRVQSYTLARRVYQDLGLKRIALLRVNDRYGRFGVAKFKDASRRLGHPVAIEQKYMPGATDMTRQLRIIADSDADGIVIWGDQAPAAAILKQMRELGMKQPIFGSFRVLGDDLLQLAGDAAEGLEAVFPFDPTRDDPAWLAFQKRYQQRFHTNPEVFASLAYDTMSILLQAIDRAGLNRGRIRDALAGTEHFKGVTGAMDFDPNSKNIVPMFLARVRNNKFEFRRYPMQAPYATIGQTQVSYNGPQLADAPAGPIHVAIFGPGAETLAANLAAIAKSYGDFLIVGIDSDAQWGKASDALVSQIYDGHALAILATDRNSSHLAEQLGVKALLPVLALSDDRTLTTTNVPWIFRLPASTDPADALRRLLDAAILAGPNRARLREVLAAE